MMMNLLHEPDQDDLFGAVLGSLNIVGCGVHALDQDLLCQQPVPHSLARNCKDGSEQQLESSVVSRNRYHGSAFNFQIIVQ